MNLTLNHFKSNIIQRWFQNENVINCLLLIHILIFLKLHGRLFNNCIMWNNIIASNVQCIILVPFESVVVISENMNLHHVFLI